MEREDISKVVLGLDRGYLFFEHAFWSQLVRAVQQDTFRKMTEAC